MGVPFTNSYRTASLHFVQIRKGISVLEQIDQFTMNKLFQSHINMRLKYTPLQNAIFHFNNFYTSIGFIAIFFGDISAFFMIPIAWFLLRLPETTKKLPLEEIKLHLRMFRLMAFIYVWCFYSYSMYYFITYQVDLFSIADTLLKMFGTFSIWFGLNFLSCEQTKPFNNPWIVQSNKI